MVRLALGDEGPRPPGGSPAGPAAPKRGTGGRLVIAALVLLFLGIELPRLSLAIAPLYDNAEYFLRAQALSTGRGFAALEAAEASQASAFVTPPLLPVLLAAPMWVVAPSMAVAKAVYYALVLLALAGLLLAFRVLVGSQAAFGPTLLTVFLPLFASWLPWLYTDVVFVCMALLAFAGAYRLSGERPPGRRSAALYGAGFSLLVWWRYVGAVWVAGLLAWLALVALVRRTRESRTALVYSSLGAALVLLPLVGWMGSTSPEFLSEYLRYSGPGGEPGTFLASDPAGVESGPALSSWPRRLTDNAFFYGVRIWSGGVLREAQYFWSFTGVRRGGLLQGLDPLVALWGALVVVGAWGRRRSRLLQMAVVGSLPYALALAFSTQRDLRYLLPLFALSSIFAAEGAIRLARGVTSRSRSSRWRPAELATLVLVLLLAARTAPTSLRCWREGPDAQLRPALSGMLDLRELCRRTAGRYPESTVLLNIKRPVARVYCGLPGTCPWNRAEIAPAALTAEIVAFERPLILRDDLAMVTRRVLDPWLESHREFVKLVDSENETRLYEVDVVALRALAELRE